MRVVHLSTSRHHVAQTDLISGLWNNSTTLNESQFDEEEERWRDSPVFTASVRERNHPFCHRTILQMSHKYMTGTLMAELMETAEVWAEHREAALITYSLLNKRRLCSGVSCSISLSAGPHMQRSGTLLRNTAVNRCLGF